MAELIAAGIALGAIYGLAGLSFVMIYNATGVANFAHGDLVVLGGMLGAAASVAAGLHPFVVMLIVPVPMVVLGVGMEIFAFRPLREKPFASTFTVSIALGIIISSALLIMLGPSPRTLPPIRPGRLDVGLFSMSWHNALIIAVTGLLVAVQWWLFHRTFLGFKLRATSQDPMTARLMGIRVNRMTTVTFGLASAYAGVAGVLLAPVVFLASDVGSTLILKIFVAVVIGGFGSVAGAVLGGVVLGVLEVLTSSYISSAYSNAIVFSLLFAILLLRPQGLLGKVEIRV